MPEYFWCVNCHQAHSMQEWQGSGTVMETSCPGCNRVSFYDLQLVIRWNKVRSIHPEIPEEGRTYPL
jgi:hypothetical protein